MTMLTINADANRFEAACGVVMTFCADMLAGAREGRDIETRYDALAQKTAAELAALGLSRADIARSAIIGR